MNRILPLCPLALLLATLLLISPALAERAVHGKHKVIMKEEKRAFPEGSTILSCSLNWGTYKGDVDLTVQFYNGFKKTARFKWRVVSEDGVSDWAEAVISGPNQRMTNFRNHDKSLPHNVGPPFTIEWRDLELQDWNLQNHLPKPSF